MCACPLCGDVDPGKYDCGEAILVLGVPRGVVTGGVGALEGGRLSGGGCPWGRVCDGIGGLGCGTQALFSVMVLAPELAILANGELSLPAEVLNDIGAEGEELVKIPPRAGCR